MTQGVYVLELNDGTRYVGSSHNIEERINQHKEGTGSTITKEKGVKGLLDLITKKKKNLIQWEKKETIAQMVKHGFNKVRGFQWTSSKNLSNAKNLSLFFRSKVAGKADMVQGKPSLITKGATPPEPMALGGTKASSVSKKITFLCP